MGMMSVTAMFRQLTPAALSLSIACYREAQAAVKIAGYGKLRATIAIRAFPKNLRASSHGYKVL